MRQRHKTKLQKLCDNKIHRDVPLHDMSVRPSVINLSDFTLSEKEINALSLGLSMSWPMSKLNNLNVKTEIEATFSHLFKICQSADISENNIDFVRSKLKSLGISYIRDKTFSPKILRDQFKTLKTLASNKELYITKFDKGNGVCVANRSDYVSKMNDILNDSTKFSKFKSSSRSQKDTFILAEDRLNRQLLKLHNDGKISKDLYTKMRSTGSQPARLYGLPKVHKSQDNPPYRPILSMPNAYNTNLSKCLNDLLKPHTPKSLELKDSFEFVDSIRSENFSNNYMVSYDLVSLFLMFLYMIPLIILAALLTLKIFL